MTNAEYLKAYKRTPKYRAYLNGYRAELRRRGLCLQCADISVKFARCLACRQRANRCKAASRLGAISLDESPRSV